MILYHFEILITNIALFFFSSVEVVFIRNEIYLTKMILYKIEKILQGLVIYRY
jgi:hypothetical protein